MGRAGSAATSAPRAGRAYFHIACEAVWAAEASAPLYEGELPPTGDLLYLVVAAGVALALGALVFRSVDDRIASEA